MTLESDIITLWGNLFPVDGYKAGLSQCRGKLFHPTDDNLHQAGADITALEARLDEIADPDLRTTAGKLLRCFQAHLDFRIPPRNVRTCADGVYAILLKKDQRAPFAPAYLEEVACMVREEVAHWRDDEDTSAGLRLLARRSADYLRDTLAVLRSENSALAGTCDTILNTLADYENLFATPGLDGDEFAPVYNWLQQNARPAQPTHGYRSILREMYDYPESAEELRQQALDWLDVEMPLVRALATELAHDYGLPERATIEQVIETMDQRNAVGPDVMTEAEEMMAVANAYTALHLLEIGPEDQIEMKQTPAYLEPLGTEGSLLSLDYLTPEPRFICYLTPSKNESRMTMLNVLVHEYGHGFNASMTSRLATSSLLKIPTTLESPIAEAIAFHREWEIWEDAAAFLERDDLLPEERGYLAIFGSDRETQRQILRAFEMETRRWRLARFLRILGDVEVHLGLRTHVDFVEWAHGKTGLCKEFIHDATFSFLKTPGYAPCYAIAGMRLGELQREAMARGISRKNFNTRVSGLGYWPRTVYDRMLKTFGKTHH